MKAKDPEGMKFCFTCSQLKPLTDFYRKSKNNDQVRSVCKLCDHVSNKKRERICRRESAEFRAKKSRYATVNSLKKLYNITPDEYMHILQAQGSVCKICRGVNLNGRQLSVDHCHKTGKIRGLLCSRCNFLIGHSMDDIKILRAAIEYLQQAVKEHYVA